SKGQARRARQAGKRRRARRATPYPFALSFGYQLSAIDCCFGSLLFAISRRGETDLDRRIWFLGIDDHSLGRLHFDQLVCPISLSSGDRKFLIFSHLKFPASVPGINEGGHRLRRGGDFSLYQCDLHVAALMFEQQLRYILIDAILIACAFWRELNNLEVSAADEVADLQELGRLAFIYAVNAKCVFYPRRKNVSERFLGGGHQMQFCDVIRV